jgi:hypothetical protein
VQHYDYWTGDGIKKSITNETGRNQYTKVVEDQNDPQPKPKSTAEAIGNEIGVAEATVKRSEKFAKGVDIIRDVDPAFADKVLSGKAQVSKTKIAEIAKAGEDLESRQQAARDVKAEDDRLSAMTQEEKSKARKEKVNQKRTMEHESASGNTTEGSSTEEGVNPVAGQRGILKTIKAAYAPMLNDDLKSDYSVDDVVSEIRDNGKMCITVLRSTLETHREVYQGSDDGRSKVCKAMYDLIAEITKLRGEFTT